MKRYKVEFTIILEEGGEPEHIVREHDVFIYYDCDGYNALVFAPEGLEVPNLMWSAVGCQTEYAAREAMEIYLRHDAVGLIDVPVRVQEVDND